MMKMNDLTFTEWFDIEKLEDIIKSPWLDERAKNGLVNYKMRAKMNPDGQGEVIVTYRQIEYSTNMCFGRYFSNGYSSQCMWNAIRSELWSEDEFDIDMVNSNPSILLTICKQYNIPTIQLDKFINDRTRFYNYVSVSEECKKKYNTKFQDNKTESFFKKHVFIMMFFGCGTKAIKDILGYDLIEKDPHVKTLYNEISQITKALIALPEYISMVSIYEAYKKGQGKTRKDKSVLPGSVLSIILGDYESKIVKQAIEYFQDKDFIVTNFIFDGFHIRETDQQAVQEALEELNQMFIDEGKPYIRFIIKPFGQKISELPEPQTGLDIKKKEIDIPKEEYVHDDNQAKKVLIKILGDRLQKDGSRLYLQSKLSGCWLTNESNIIEIIQDSGIKSISGKKVFDYCGNLSKATSVFNSIKNQEALNVNFIVKQNQKLLNLLHYKTKIFDFRDKKFHDYAEQGYEAIPFFKINHDLTDLFEITHPKVIAFKHKIISVFGSEECQDYVIKIYARCLTGNFRDKTFIITLGERNSGKGSFQASIIEAFGDYIGSVSPPIKRGQTGDSACENREIITMQLDLKRLAFSNEGSSTNLGKVKFDSDKLKSWVSGGDTLIAREHYKGEISTVVNAILNPSFNPMSMPEPDKDELQTCIIISTTGQFTKNPENEFESQSENIKKWINDPDNEVAKCWLSLLAYHYSEVEMRDIKMPDEFRNIQKEVQVEDTSFTGILKSKFDVDLSKTGNKWNYKTPIELVNSVFSKSKLTSTMITQNLKKVGVTKTNGYFNGLRCKGESKENESSCLV